MREGFSDLASPNPSPTPTPQELDEDFLVVWDGFSDPPWKSFKEPALRAFLLERIQDGFCFPMNPIWPIRDVGWHAVLQAWIALPSVAMHV